MRVNGPAIRAIRTDQGTSLRRLAAAAGVSAPYLSRLERDLRGTAWVSEQTVTAIAAALTMPVAAITSINNGRAA
jgi:transcriptional regulator with XRE-family HTH domain